MDEAKGSIDAGLLARCQRKTLNEVMLTFFRILKTSTEQTSAPLLPATLEGLAKFAPLVNMDTVSVGR